MSVREEGARLVDLSHRLTSGGTVFPGDPQIRLAPAARIDADGFAVTSVTMGSHSGTHVDAPSHTVAGGRMMDDVDVARLIGRAHLLRVPGLAPRERIGLARLEDQLAALPDDARIVLLVTGWDRFWGDAAYLDHPFLDGPVGSACGTAGSTCWGWTPSTRTRPPPRGPRPCRCTRRCSEPTASSSRTSVGSPTCRRPSRASPSPPCPSRSAARTGHRCGRSRGSSLGACPPPCTGSMDGFRTCRTWRGEPRIREPGTAPRPGPVADRGEGALTCDVIDRIRGDNAAVTRCP